MRRGVDKVLCCYNELEKPLFVSDLAESAGVSRGQLSCTRTLLRDDSSCGQVAFTTTKGLCTDFSHYSIRFDRIALLAINILDTSISGDLIGVEA